MHLILVSTLLEKTGKFFIWLLIAIYRTLGTTHLGGGCRFEPSCSAYALETIKIHKIKTAFPLIINRLFSCRPGGRCGYDPVPRNARELNAKSKQ